MDMVAEALHRRDGACSADWYLAIEMVDCVTHIAMRPTSSIDSSVLTLLCGE